jgi:recombination protein RecA
MAKRTKATPEATETKVAPGASPLLTRLVDKVVAKHGEESGLLEGRDGLSLRIKGFISTRCPELDEALGERGGIPQGRLTVLTGGDGSGKTTAALHLAAETQAMKGLAVYCDKEHKLDLDYAQALGVDVENMPISQPDHLEGVLAVMESWTELAKEWRAEMGAEVPVTFILDSTNSAITKAEFEGDWDDVTVGSQSRVFSSKLPKLVAMAQRNNITLLFIGQVREKIGVMYGKKTDISGGKSLKHHACCIVEFVRTGSKSVGGSKDKKSGRTTGGTKVGNEVKATVTKNQMAPPFREASFFLRFGEGFDALAGVFKAAVKAKMIEKSGSWFSLSEDLGGDRIGQGEEKAQAFLKDNPKLVQAIQDELRKRHDAKAKG